MKEAAADNNPDSEQLLEDESRRETHGRELLESGEALVLQSRRLLERLVLLQLQLDLIERLLRDVHEHVHEDRSRATLRRECEELKEPDCGHTH